MLRQYQAIAATHSTRSRLVRLAGLAVAVATLIPAAQATAAGPQSRQAAESARADIQKTLGFVPQFVLGSRRTPRKGATLGGQQPCPAH